MSKILISELLRNTLQFLWQLINGLGKWCCNTGHGNSHSFIPFLCWARLEIRFMEIFMAKERNHRTPPPYSRVLMTNFHAPFHCNICAFNHTKYELPTCDDAANQEVPKEPHRSLHKIMLLYLSHSIGDIPSHRWYKLLLEKAEALHFPQEARKIPHYIWIHLVYSLWKEFPCKELECV